MENNFKMNQLNWNLTEKNNTKFMVTGELVQDQYGNYGYVS